MTAGGPAGATRPILQYVYEVGFTGYRLGYASAISYIFFFLIIVLSIVVSVVQRRNSKRSVNP
jgi:ABC-type sugar transport system permease subunit